MTTIPTTEAIAELEYAVAEDGFDRHQREVREFAQFTREAGAPETLTETLEAAAATEFERARAFLVLSQDWPHYERRLQDMHRNDDPKPIELINAWREHQDLQSAGAGLIDLWGSRRHLDAVREGVQTAQCA